MTGTCAKTALPNGAGCDDGSKCTAGDICKDGGCIAGTDICSCKTDVDCVDQEDGNPCNGTLYCVKKTGKCAVNNATILPCAVTADTACARAACDRAAKTHTCKLTPIENVAKVCADSDAKLCWLEIVGDGQGVAANVGCEDGDTCTINDTCKTGKCVSGPDQCACKSDKDCGAFENGNACDGTMVCDFGHKDSTGKSAPRCVVSPKTIVKCPTAGDTDCITNTCIAATGVCQPLFAKPGTPCEDGDKCTIKDTCVATGACVAGTPGCFCEDDSSCAGQDDGDLCNGTLFCDKSNAAGPVCKLDPKSLVLCPTVDDKACIANACDPKTGKCSPTHREKTAITCFLGDGSQCTAVKLPAGTTKANVPCSDGDACTAGDVCGSGACISGTFICACTGDADCAK